MALGVIKGIIDPVINAAAILLLHLISNIAIPDRQFQEREKDIL
jgi:hypothetical protein